MSHLALGSPRRLESPSAPAAEKSAPAIPAAPAPVPAPAPAPTAAVSTNTTPVARAASAVMTTATTTSTTSSPPPEPLFARRAVGGAPKPGKSGLSRLFQTLGPASSAAPNSSASPAAPASSTAPATSTSPTPSESSTLVASYGSQTDVEEEALISPNATSAPILILGAVPTPRGRQRTFPDSAEERPDRDDWSSCPVE
ncbi:hypothetical protein C8A03DRAFT_37813 [Achaetomium macrosporum]|uniref:Uncharacterized protein n=1 Tax=Achaetomium macrosporum TaxID=79813 RepID=A0AAN7C4N2_9PEZI|nr:hypothetical protein C8A03DRAFT_37813 [Achaetomium macrosporum]